MREQVPPLLTSFFITGESGLNRTVFFRHRPERRTEGPHVVLVGSSVSPLRITVEFRVLAKHCIGDVLSLLDRVGQPYRPWIEQRFPPNRFRQLVEKMDPTLFAVAAFIQALGQNPGLEQELTGLGSTPTSTSARGSAASA